MCSPAVIIPHTPQIQGSIQPTPCPCDHTPLMGTHTTCNISPGDKIPPPPNTTTNPRWRYVQAPKQCYLTRDIR